MKIAVVVEAVEDIVAAAVVEAVADIVAAAVVAAVDIVAAAETDIEAIPTRGIDFLFDHNPPVPALGIDSPSLEKTKRLGGDCLARSVPIMMA